MQPTTNTRNVERRRLGLCVCTIEPCSYPRMRVVASLQMVPASETGMPLMVFLILLDLTIIILLEVLDPFVIKLYVVSYEVGHSLYNS